MRHKAMVGRAAAVRIAYEVTDCPMLFRAFASSRESNTIDCTRSR
jgi:hypothetical protein